MTYFNIVNRGYTGQIDGYGENIDNEKKVGIGRNKNNEIFTVHQFGIGKDMLSDPVTIKHHDLTEKVKGLSDKMRSNVAFTQATLKANSLAEGVNTPNAAKSLTQGVNVEGKITGGMGVVRSGGNIMGAAMVMNVSGTMKSQEQNVYNVQKTPPEFMQGEFQAEATAFIGLNSAPYFKIEGDISLGSQTASISLTSNDKNLTSSNSLSRSNKKTNISSDSAVLSDNIRLTPPPQSKTRNR